MVEITTQEMQVLYDLFNEKRKEYEVRKPHIQKSIRDYRFGHFFLIVGDDGKPVKARIRKAYIKWFLLLLKNNIAEQKNMLEQEYSIPLETKINAWCSPIFFLDCMPSEKGLLERLIAVKRTEYENENPYKDTGDSPETKIKNMSAIAYKLNNILRTEKTFVS
ncbi:MAG: hypothetical protein FWG63_03905 [Defluviitaleaceae bacterium]|nr:hypothetical protein [Defluviitaleaceae bacterium]